MWGNLTSTPYYIDKNQNLTFTEMSYEYVIDDPGTSMQSTFFDDDKDNALDLNAVNYPIVPCTDIGSNPVYN